MTGHWHTQFHREFGQNVRDHRDAKGWTLAQVAEMTGVLPQSICNIEKGRQGTTLEGLLRLADAFGCTPNDLLPTVPAPSAGSTGEEGPHTDV